MVQDQDGGRGWRGAWRRLREGGRLPWPAGVLAIVLLSALGWTAVVAVAAALLC